MSYKERLREAINAMTDSEADALLRWIEQRREVAPESAAPADRARTSAAMIREDRDR